MSNNASSNSSANTNTHSLVQKLWNYCNVLRDDGMSYGDYVEQLTYLLFLKMADERGKPPHNQASIATAGPHCWRATATRCLTITVTRWSAWAWSAARWG